jgi:hypothetical protein
MERASMMESGVIFFELKAKSIKHKACHEVRRLFLLSALGFKLSAQSIVVKYKILITL